MLSQLSVYALLESEISSQELRRLLSYDRHNLFQYDSEDTFLGSIRSGDQQPDCLILQEGLHFVSLVHSLIEAEILLPAVILVSEITSEPSHQTPACHYYHPAEILLSLAQLEQIQQAVDRAISQFLRFSPLTNLSQTSSILPHTEDVDHRLLLMHQQRRLSEKLKERLGYLGVYYKRDPKQFLRYLPPQKAQELLDTLSSLYRGIVLNYFVEASNLNSLIDEFVNLAFFADIPVTSIVEMHMELMDEFSKQLKLEGRSEEILLDYRLTLIDTIAHLCEMYRRSIPREA